jgi:hypothetical protein
MIPVTLLKTVLRHILHMLLYKNMVSGEDSCPGSAAAQLLDYIDSSIDAFVSRQTRL